MKNRREQQNRFLQPIQDSKRQGDKNSRIFLKVKVIQASSLLNSYKDRIFSIPGQQPSNLNLFHANFAEQFMFGAQDDYLTPDLKSSKIDLGSTH